MSDSPAEITEHNSTLDDSHLQNAVELALEEAKPRSDSV